MWKVLFALSISLSVSGCSVYPLLVAGSLDPGRYKANEEARSRCQKDGGIHVYQKASLQRGRFPTVIPDAKYDGGWIKQGLIYGRYRFDDSYTYEQVYGYTLYRYRTSITSVDDGALIGELVYYVRQGEPGLPGITCPEGLQNEKLINAVFLQEGEQTDPYPVCHVGSPEKKAIASDTANLLFGEKLKGNARDNVEWQRGINCDERTKIDRWYDKIGEHEIRLAGTRLLFFGANGNRCQTLAMPDSRQIVCDEKGVTVFGYKRRETGLIRLIQRYSKTGEMEYEYETPP
jgi:hypothetical protein